MLGINLKLPAAEFWRTHSRRETQGVCLTLQMSPGRGEAGAALQGAKNLRLRGTAKISFKEELARIDAIVLCLCSTPISALLCSAAYMVGFFT